MIPIRELINDIDVKLNKVATNSHQSIPDEQMVIAINDAITNLILTKLSENNIYKEGLDSFLKRYEDLEGLVERSEMALTLDGNSTIRKIYLGNLLSLNPNYMFMVPGSGVVYADRGECLGVPLVVNLIKHSDVSVLMNNTNTRPSFDYQETIATISEYKIEIYTDNVFIPRKLSLQYIRYPKKVDISGYIHLDGVTSSTDEDSDMPYYMKEQITDLAVRNLAMYIDNQNTVQNTSQKLQNDE